MYYVDNVAYFLESVIAEPVCRYQCVGEFIKNKRRPCVGEYNIIGEISLVSLHKKTCPNGIMYQDDVWSH